MSDIETLDILPINCSTIECKHKMSTFTIRWKFGELHTNKMQEASKPEKCNVNTTIIPSSNSKDNPEVIENNNSKINHLLSDPHRKVTKSKYRNHAKIT